jgi:hypothetical protein
MPNEHEIRVSIIAGNRVNACRFSEDLAFAGQL